MKVLFPFEKAIHFFRSFNYFTLSENIPSLGFANMVSGFFFMSKFKLAFIVLMGVWPLQRKGRSFVSEFSFCLQKGKYLHEFKEIFLFDCLE